MQHVSLPFTWFFGKPTTTTVSCCFSAQHRLDGGRAADSSCVKVDRKVLCSVTCKEAPVCKRWGFWLGFWSERNMFPYHKWLTMVQSLLWNYEGGQVLDSIVPKINIKGAKQSSISSEKVPILSCLTIVVPTKVKSWGNRRRRPLWSQIGKTEHLETYWKSWSGSLIRSLSIAVIKAAQ